MRFDEVNDKGGIHGRKVRLVVEDTQYQVPRAVQAGTKLINRDRIFAMVAPLGTPMNNALFKDQFEAGVPNLFPLSAARSMYEPFHRLKFYGAASYVDQVRAGRLVVHRLRPVPEPRQADVVRVGGDRRVLRRPLRRGVQVFAP